MTLIVHVSCPDGVAVSADSRACCEVPDDAGHTAVLPFSDGDQKLAVFHGRYIVSWYGRTASPSIAEALRQLAAHPAVAAAEGKSVERFAGALAEATATEPESYLGLAYIDALGAARVACVIKGKLMFMDLDPQTSRPTPACYFPLGWHDVLDALLPSKDPPKVPIRHFSLQDAVDFSRWAVQISADFHRFQARPQLIGGPILTAIATRTEGARIIRGRTIELREFGLARAGA